MPNTLKCLGQRFPAAATEETIYTVPAGTQAVVSSLIITNTSATPTSFLVRLKVAGAADDSKQFLAYLAPIGANEIVTIGNWCLGATDVVKVYATLATVAFNMFGQEIQP